MSPSNDAAIRVKQREQLKVGVELVHEALAERIRLAIETIEVMRDGLGVRNVQNCYVFDDIQAAIVHARALRTVIRDLVTSVDAL